MTTTLYIDETDYFTDFNVLYNIFIDV